MFAKAFVSGLVAVATTVLCSSFVRWEIADGIGSWVGMVVFGFTLQPRGPRTVAGIVFGTLAVAGITYQRVRQDAIGFAVMVSALTIAVVITLWSRKKLARTP